MAAHHDQLDEAPAAGLDRLRTSKAILEGIRVEMAAVAEPLRVPAAWLEQALSKVEATLQLADGQTAEEGDMAAQQELLDWAEVQSGALLRAASCRATWYRSQIESRKSAAPAEPAAGAEQPATAAAGGSSDSRPQGSNSASDGEEEEGPGLTASEAASAMWTVRVLVGAGVPLTELDEHARSPLHQAAIAGDCDLAHALLAPGGQPLEQLCRHGWEPEPNDAESVILESGIRDQMEQRGQHHNPQVCDGRVKRAEMIRLAYSTNHAPHQATPLHVAAAHGHVDMVALLIGAGAKVEALCVSQWTPLHLAAQRNHAEVIRCLVAHGAQVGAKDAVGATPLHWSVFMKGIEGMRILVEEGGADIFVPNKNEQSPAFLAAYKGSEEAFDAMVPAGAVGDELMQRGSRWQSSMLHAAASGGSGPIIRRILAAGVDANHRNAAKATALHVAAESGSIAALKVLVEEGGVDVNARNVHGAPALMCAIDLDKPEAAVWLVQHGADARAKNRHGVSALHLAASNGQLAVVRALLQAGAVDEPDGPGGRTGLVRAIDASSAPVTTALLQAGSDPNLRSRDGYTPLSTAARSRREPAALVEALLAGGADPLLLSEGHDWSLTAAHVALLDDHDEAFRFLLRAVGGDSGRFLVAGARSSLLYCGLFGTQDGALRPAKRALAYGCNPNAPGNLGHRDTPLTVSVGGGSAASTRLLRAAGSDDLGWGSNFEGATGSVIMLVPELRPDSLLAVLEGSLDL